MTGFPSILGGLGCDRGFLCHDRDFWPHVAIEILVSRQGLGLGQVWVAKRVSLCHDRVSPKGGILYRNRVPSVTTRVGTTTL